MAIRSFIGGSSVGLSGQALWSDPLNWSPPFVPTTGDSVIFDRDSLECELDVATAVLTGFDSRGYGTNNIGLIISDGAFINVTGAAADVYLAGGYQFGGATIIKWTRDLYIDSNPGELSIDAGTLQHTGTGTVYNAVGMPTMSLAAAGFVTTLGNSLTCNNVILGGGTLALGTSSLTVATTNASTNLLNGTGSSVTATTGSIEVDSQGASNQTCGPVTAACKIAFVVSPAVTLKLAGDINLGTAAATIQCPSTGTGTLNTNGHLLNATWSLGTPVQGSKIGKLIVGTANHQCKGAAAAAPIGSAGILDLSGCNFTLTGTLDGTRLTCLASSVGAVSGGTVKNVNLAGQSHLHAYTSTDGGGNTNVDFTKPAAGRGMFGGIIGGGIIP